MTLARFFPRWLLPVCVAGLLSSCATERAQRIAAHAERFAQLTEDAQRHVRNGDVDLGWDAETVFMALGKPTRVLKVAEPEGAERWAYRNYVYGTGSAAAVTMAAPGGFADPSRSAGPGGGRGSSVPSRAPNTTPGVTLDTSASGVGTLYLDFVEGRVVRIRVDPY